MSVWWTNLPLSDLRCCTAMRSTVSLSSLRDMGLHVGIMADSSSIRLFILSRRLFSIWLWGSLRTSSVFIVRMNPPTLHAIRRCSDWRITPQQCHTRPHAAPKPQKCMMRTCETNKKTEQTKKLPNLVLYMWGFLNKYKQIICIKIKGGGPFSDQFNDVWTLK